MQGSLSDGFEGKKERESGSMKNRTQQLPFAVSEAAKTIARKFSGREKEKRNGRRKTALSRLLFCAGSGIFPDGWTAEKNYATMERKSRVGHRALSAV